MAEQQTPRLTIPLGAEGVVENLLARTGWSRERCIELVSGWPSWMFGNDAGAAGELLEDIADAMDRSDDLLLAMPFDLRDRIEEWRARPSSEETA